MDLSELVFSARVEQDPFGRGGLAGIYMRGDPDIPDGAEINGAHSFSPYLRFPASTPVNV
jgi:hypothetical protein